MNRDTQSKATPTPQRSPGVGMRWLARVVRAPCSLDSASLTTQISSHENLKSPLYQVSEFRQRKPPTDHKISGLKRSLASLNSTYLISLTEVSGGMARIRTSGSNSAVSGRNQVVVAELLQSSHCVLACNTIPMYSLCAISYCCRLPT
jgi:hypothetical protein